jgi:ATP-dependent Clp protease, protease subunit
MQKKNTRNIYLFGDVTNERTERFINQLHILFSEGKTPITIYINSSGGSVTDALAIYDTLKSAPGEISMIALGKVHSAAITIFLAAPRERRFSYPHTEFMSHDISWSSEGPRAFLKDRVDQLEHTVIQLLKIYTEDTYLSEEEARKLFFTDHGDHYFDAYKAVSLGFVGEVLVTTQETSRTARVSLNEIPVSTTPESLAVQESELDQPSQETHDTPGT